MTADNPIPKSGGLETPSDIASVGGNQVDKSCAFCGAATARNSYYQQRACDNCMAEKTKGQPPAIEITDFPGQRVQEYLDNHGELPS